MKATTAKRLHLLGAGFWFAQMVAIVYIMWPADWKMYLVEISLAANVISHLSGASAERPTKVER
jgi:uncharacterized membrane protein